MQKISDGSSAWDDKKISRAELPREIPIEKLYPPRVFFLGEKFEKSLSGIINKNERRVFESLPAEFKKNNGVMTESELIGFLSKRLPEARVQNLLSPILNEEGLVKKEVVLDKEEFPDYLKGLMPHLAWIRKQPTNAALKSYGIKEKFWPILNRYEFALIRPFLENPKKTHEFFQEQLNGFRDRDIPDELAIKCITYGILKADAEKFKDPVNDAKKALSSVRISEKISRGTR